MEHSFNGDFENIPSVDINTKEGVITIEGRSTPTDPMPFYKQLADSIKELTQGKDKLRLFNIKLSIINTRSSKWLLHSFKILEEYYEEGNSFQINWYYEEDDDSMYEAGLDYQSILKVPFKFFIINN